MKSYTAKDKMCVGSWQSILNVYTTLCMEDQPFKLITSIAEPSLWNWKTSSGDTANYSICGLGKESTDNGSQSWLTRAMNQKLITNNTYSYVIAPYLNQSSIDNTNKTV